MFRYAVPALSLLLAGCITLGDSDEPIASLRMPAPVPGSEKVAIVVLPGFGHGAGKLRDEFVQDLTHNFEAARSVAQRGIAQNLNEFAAATFTHAVQAYTLDSPAPLGSCDV